MTVITKLSYRPSLLNETYTEVEQDPMTLDLVYPTYQSVYSSSFHHRYSRVDSTVSVKPQLKKKILVSWKPSKFKLTEPKKPVLFLKSPPVLKPRYPGQSSDSYRRAVALFHKISAEVRIKNWSRTQNYEARMVKYEKALANYRKYLSFSQFGAPRMVKKRGKVFDEWHSYDESLTIYTPPTGWILRSYRDFVFDVNNNLIRGENISGRNYSRLTGEVVGLRYDVTAALSLQANEEVNLLMSAAKSRARKRLSDAYGNSELQLANIIAERHQTLSMLGGTVKRIASILSGRVLSGVIVPRHQRGLSLDDLRKQASDDTLAFMFGIRPLLNDVYTSAKLLAEQLTDPEKQTVTVRASAKVRSTVSSPTGINLENDYYPDILDNGRTTINVRLTTRSSYVLEFYIENETLATLNSLGLVNPLEPAWETMPWSFLIDWIYPIGTFIKSLTEQKGLSFKRGTYAEKSTIDYQATTNWSNAPLDDPETGIVNGVVSGSKIEIRKTRELLTEPPGVFIPEFKSPISAYHIIEAIALISQRIKR